MIFVGFCSLYVSKIVNFGRLDALICYKQKCKVASFNLAHPVYIIMKGLNGFLMIQEDI